MPAKKRKEPDDKLDKYYTDDRTILRAITLLRTLMTEFERVNAFPVDFSCGPNQWVFEMAGHDEQYVAVDIDPPQNARGKVVTADWLELKREDISIPEGRTVVLGFNPPYGRSSIMARRMISHGIELVQPHFLCVICPYSVSENIRRWPGMTDDRFIRERVPDFAFRRPDGKITWHTSSYIVAADLRNVTSFKWMSGFHVEQGDGFKVGTAPKPKYMERVDIAVRTKGSRAGWEFVTSHPWQHTIIDPGTEIFTANIPTDVVDQFIAHPSFTLVQFDDPDVISAALLKRICWEVWRSRGPYSETNTPTIPNYVVADCVSRSMPPRANETVRIQESARRAGKGDSRHPDTHT